MRVLVVALCVLSAQALKLPQNELPVVAKSAEQQAPAGKPVSSMIEFMSDDIYVKLDAASKEKGSSQMLFIGGMIAASIGISLIYWDRGITAVVAINAYVMVLANMSNSIRSVFVEHNFGYPRFVTSCHALCTCVVILTFLMLRQATSEKKITVPTVTSWMRSIAPGTLCFALSLGCSNLALLYTNTHFYEMLSASNVIFVAAVGSLFGRTLNSKLFLPLGLISVALPILAFGEIKFSLVGLAICLAGNFFRASKAQIQTSLLIPGAASQTFEPLELTCWTSMLTFVLMMTWSLVSEGVEPWKVFCKWDAGILTSVGISCIFATTLNASGMFVMREVGPVGQMIIGELKGVLACVGAVAAFGEMISVQQMIAYPIVISGAFWYNRTDKQVKAEEAEEKANLGEKNIEAQK